MALHSIIFDELPLTSRELAEQIGLLNNIAFLSLIDNGLMIMSECMCCYTLNTNVKYCKKKVSESLTRIKKFYNKKSHIESAACTKYEEQCNSIIPPAEIFSFKQYQNSLDSTDNILRKVNSISNDICIILPECEPENIWIYDSQKIRHILKKAKVHFREAPYITIKKLKYKYKLLVLSTHNRAHTIEKILFC